MSDGLGLADNDVGDSIISILRVSDVHAVCTPFCGSRVGSWLTGTNTPFARDKDAVVASMALCEAAAYYKTRNMTLWDAMLAMLSLLH